MDSLTIYPDGTNKPGLNILTANGFVSRVVSAVSDVNIPDAVRAAKLLNAVYKLADAVRPFANLGVGSGPCYETEHYYITRDAIRNARAALEALSAEQY